MATTPIPTTITDPISADVITGLTALTALCNFLSTEQGQKLIAKTMDDVNAVESAVSKALKAIGDFLHLQLPAAAK